MTEHSPPLSTAIEHLWASTSDDDELIRELELSTVLARARTGRIEEASRCLPRLLEALVDGELSPVEGIEVIELLPGAVAGSVVAELLDAWWHDVLQREPGEHRPGIAPDDVLGLLAHAEPPMVRWLHPWLDALDGPAAVHLADAIVAGFPAPTWAGREDRRQQVMAWTRSETVINGLALIGATHIDGDVMSKVLDVVILGAETGGAHA